ncbi:MAG: hypothetical protein L0G70_06250 [Rubrobacter sp.]|nr:hypothetical protein [Rubrobacter sp.]
MASAVMLGFAVMRSDLEYLTGVLDELESLVQDGSKVPMNRGRVMVDRSEAQVLVQELRNSLPKELAQSEEARREYESIVSSAREEAERTVENARVRAQELVEDSEPYRRSQRMAEENLDRADKYSHEVCRGSEAYREQVMAKLERWFGDSMESVAAARGELESPSGREQEQPREESAGEDDTAEEDDERGWRVNSA